MARHTAKSHKIRKVEILVIQIINGLVAANPVALLFALLIAAAIIVDFVCIKIYVKTNSALFLQLENAQEMQEKVYV